MGLPLIENFDSGRCRCRDRWSPTEVACKSVCLLWYGSFSIKSMDLLSINGVISKNTTSKVDFR